MVWYENKWSWDSQNLIPPFWTKKSYLPLFVFNPKISTGASFTSSSDFFSDYSLSIFSKASRSIFFDLISCWTLFLICFILLAFLTLSSIFLIIFILPFFPIIFFFKEILVFLASAFLFFVYFGGLPLPLHGFSGFSIEISSFLYFFNIFLSFCFDSDISKLPTDSEVLFFPLFFLFASFFFYFDFSFLFLILFYFFFIFLLVISFLEFYFWALLPLWEVPFLRVFFLFTFDIGLVFWIIFLELFLEDAF